MKKLFTVVYFILFLSGELIAQQFEIGTDFGRAYFIYSFKDYGKGFINEGKINYGMTGGFTLRKNLTEKKFWETGLRFSLYEQYYSTRKYGGAWEQVYPVFYIPALVGYQSNKKFGFTASGGIILSVMPDQYESDYEAIFIYPYLDSITRGTMKRNFTPIFPLLNINAGVKYKINSNWQAELKAGYGKGFFKITEYNIYYNDGSGSNDQRAKQWGKGDFASLTLGVKYRLKQKSRKLNK